MNLELTSGLLLIIPSKILFLSVPDSLFICNHNYDNQSVLVSLNPILWCLNWL